MITQAGLLDVACEETLRRYEETTDPDKAAMLLRTLAQLEAKLLALYPTMGLLRDSVQRRNSANADEAAERERRFRRTFGGGSADDEDEL